MQSGVVRLVQVAQVLFDIWFDIMSASDSDRASTQVMSEMVGKWRLESREGNFDSFLACREVGWMMRRLMTSSSPDVEYTLSDDKSTFTKLTTTYGGTRYYSHNCFPLLSIFV